MIDANVLVRTWLLTPSLTIEGQLVVNQVPLLLQSLFTPGAPPPNDDPLKRIYAGHLRPGFDPNFGPALVVRVGSGTTAGTGGGAAHSELPIVMPRMQLTAWANVSQYDIARQLYAAAYDWMQRRNGIDLGGAGYILSCLEQVEGQDVDDPHTGFATVFGFWKLMLREQAAA
jgi:hypothetical protein